MVLFISVVDNISIISNSVTKMVTEKKSKTRKLANMLFFFSLIRGGRVKIPLLPADDASETTF